MKKAVRLCTLIFTISIFLLLSGCAITKEQVMELLAPSGKTENSQVQTVTPVELVEVEVDTTQYFKKLEGNFNPFTATDDGDLAVIKATQLTLADMGGGNISAKENEDGTYTVTVELPGDLFFSDGEPVNIDDLLFTLYVMLDENYDGNGTFSSLPVLGLEDYYHGVNKDLWDKYSVLFDETYNEGHYDEALVKKLKETQVAQPYNDLHEQWAREALEAFSQEKADDIRKALEQVWREDAAHLVDTCMQKYSATVEYHTGYTLEQVEKDPRLQIMAAMVELTFGNLLEDGTLVGKKTGTSWDMKESFPTVDDFFNEMYESYGGSAETYWAIEGIGRGDITEMAKTVCVKLWASQDEEWDGGIVRIPGIVRIGDRLATITFETLSPDYLKAVTELYLLPSHYFAVDGLFDYANCNYGFPTGNTSKIVGRQGETVGAGEYSLQSFGNGRAVLLNLKTGEEQVFAEADLVNVAE